MPIRRWLSLLTYEPRPCLHRLRWRERLGDEVVRSLERARLFEGLGRADWYPCAGFCAGRNQRNVLDEPNDDGRWVAVCGDGEESCEDAVLTDGDLELLQVAPNLLARWLREALSATGAPLRVAHRRGVEGLGQLVWEGEVREGLVVVGGARDVLARMLEEREHTRAATVVFVPTFDGLDGTLLARHGPGSQVVLVDLREWLTVEAARLVLVPARSGTQRVLPVREPAAVPYAAEPIVAEVFEVTGKRVLSTGEYQALVQGRQSLDLFVDLTAPGDRRGVRAGHRDAQGAFVEKELTLSEATILVELVQTRRALRCRDFSVQASAVTRAFERARKKVDVPVTRYRWRAFQTQGGSEPTAKRFLFDPPEKFTFAVVVPSSA